MTKKKIEEENKKLFDEKQTLEKRVKALEEMFQKLSDRHGWV